MWKPRSSAARRDVPGLGEAVHDAARLAGALFAHDRERVGGGRRACGSRAACRPRAPRGCACESARAASRDRRSAGSSRARSRRWRRSSVRAACATSMVDRRLRRVRVVGMHADARVEVADARPRARARAAKSSISTAMHSACVTRSSRIASSSCGRSARSSGKSRWQCESTNIRIRSSGQRQPTTCQKQRSQLAASALTCRLTRYIVCVGRVEASDSPRIFSIVGFAPPRRSRPA